MTNILNCLFIAAGLIIGSFTNVLIYRLPRRESVDWPGSHCPSCNNKLRNWELIPVISFIILKGRCRYCQNSISPQYPLVEIMSAAVYWLVFRNYGLSVATAAGCILATIMISAAFCDLQTGLIPDRLTYPGILIGLALAYFTVGLKNSFLGILGFAACFLIIAVATRGGMGGGDIKLAGVIGAFTGWQGALLSFVLASLMGGLAAAYLLLRGKANRKTAIRFGPYLALAAIISLLWGKQIISFYMGNM